jgi:peptidoglycan DL-endopeptidase CwlO
VAEPDSTARAVGASRSSRSVDSEFPTRRALREAQELRSHRAAAPQPPASASPSAERARRMQSSRPTPRPQASRPAPRPAAKRAKRRSMPRTVFSALVMIFATGLVATVALPSYAFNPSGADASAAGGTSSKVTAAGQSLTVDADVTAPTVKRDSFAVTTAAELKRATYAKTFSSYTGKTAADYIKNPAYPDFSLNKVIATAEQYLGVPYVFGGATPAGFDCSGFVMFVYAQFGVSLQHSVHMQNQEGEQISEADAKPGDVVVFNDLSHDGFYLGNGMILHAPYPGARVRIQQLWSTDVHFVRFGTN